MAERRSCGAGGVLALALALGAAGCGAEPAPAPPVAAPPVAPAAAPAGPKVIVLGDSITAGLGLPVDQAFPAVTEQLLRDEGVAVSVQNAGVSGDTSAAGAARLGWLLKQKPAVLVVELGGNDLLRGQPVAETRARLDEICRRARDAGAAVVMLGITAPGAVGPDHKAAFDGIYPEVAAGCGATLLPGFLEPLMAAPDMVQADGLHPTAAGQRVLAKALVPVLRTAVSAGPPSGPGDRAD